MGRHDRRRVQGRVAAGPSAKSGPPAGRWGFGVPTGRDASVEMLD